MAALIGAGAFISIPLPISPIPVTLQDLFIILAGFILGPKYGVLAVLLYMAAGALGLPIFSGGKGGGGVIFGPTGGYFVGFILVVLVSAAVRKVKPLFSFLACFGALLVMLALGSMRLAQVLDIPLVQGFVIGFLPFVPGSVVKTLCALPVYKFLKKSRLVPYDQG